METNVKCRHSLNETIAGCIWSAIASGATRKGAAASSGISYMTLHRWLKRGKQDRESGSESIFARFAEGFEHAKAVEAVTRPIRKLRVDAYMAGQNDALQRLKNEEQPPATGARLPLSGIAEHG